MNYVKVMLGRELLCYDILRIYHMMITSTNEYAIPKSSCKVAGLALVRPWNIFVDASYSKNVAGLAGVCLDQNGKWQQGFMVKLRCSSANEAEVLGLKQAILWAKDNDWTTSAFYADSEIASKGVNQPMYKDKLTNHYNNCRDFLQTLTRRCTGIQKIQGAWNGVSDVLARRAGKDLGVFDEPMRFVHIPLVVVELFDAANVILWCKVNGDTFSRLHRDPSFPFNPGVRDRTFVIV